MVQAILVAVEEVLLLQHQAVELAALASFS
jgi:hypothetical protein